MKVTHTNYFKPAPFWGAAIQGAFNTLGAGIDASTQRELARMQMEHDHEMAGVNYNYSINQMNHSSHLQKGIMDKQQEQAIELMDYQNAYNDPSAVRQRYQAAGISPQAAFGSGAAGGAGIAGSFSMPSGSAPSGGSTGHSSNIMYRTNFAGIGSGMAQAINDARRIDAQNKRDMAEAEAARAKAKNDWLEAKRKEFLYTDEFLSSEQAALLSDHQRKNYETNISRLNSLREENLSSYYDVMNAATMRERVAAAKLAEDRLKEQEQIIENLRKDGIIKDETANKVRAQVKTEGAEYEVKMAQARQFSELAELAVKDQELRSEQTRKITHDIIQGYISAGSDAISAITDIVSMLTPIMGLSKAKRTATRVVTEEYDKAGNLKGKKITRSDDMAGYTDIPH